MEGSWRRSSSHRIEAGDTVQGGAVSGEAARRKRCQGTPRGAGGTNPRRQAQEGAREPGVQTPGWEVSLHPEGRRSLEMLLGGGGRWTRRAFRGAVLGPGAEHTCGHRSHTLNTSHPEPHRPEARWSQAAGRAGLAHQPASGQRTGTDWRPHHRCLRRGSLHPDSAQLRAGPLCPQARTCHRGDSRAPAGLAGTDRAAC